MQITIKFFEWLTRNSNNPHSNCNQSFTCTAIAIKALLIHFLVNNVDWSSSTFIIVQGVDAVDALLIFLFAQTKG